MHYSFCPVCGGRLGLPPQGKTRGPDDLRICGSCGHDFWLNSKPCVSALIVRADGLQHSILLTRRAIDPYRGCWDIPGGYLRNGEPPESGLARELAEELSAPLLQPLLAAIEVDEYLRDDVPREARFTFNVFYLSTLPRDIELKPADDVSEARWFPLAEVPSDLAFASNRRALARLRPRIEEYASRLRGAGSSSTGGH
jgi:8-oxo-dGTP diphosphatase